MNILNCIQIISPFWQKNNGEKEAVTVFEKNNNILLPQDFKEFLDWSNGGQGKFPKIYLDLWKVQEFPALNHDYQIGKYLGKKFLAFGSDGGPNCFLFDYRQNSNPFISSVDFGDLDVSEVRVVATSFVEFLEVAINGKLIDKEL